MAWRNIRLNTNWPGAVQCDVSDFSLLSLTTWPSNWGSYISNEPASVLSDFNNGTFFGASPNYVEGIINNTNSCIIRIHCSGWSSYYSYGNVFLVDSSVRWGYIACVDDDTQKGFFCMLNKTLNTGNISQWAGTFPPYPNSEKDNTNVRSKMYTLLTGNEYSQKKSGGAGSGYIGNSLVSNKKMIGYNVPTSDAESTKTESVQVYSAAPFSNKPKMGDGFVRIKFLRDLGPVPPEYKDYIDIINGKTYKKKWWLSDNWFSTMTAENFDPSLNITILRSPSSVTYGLEFGGSRGCNVQTTWNNKNQRSNMVACYYEESEGVNSDFHNEATYWEATKVILVNNGNDYTATAYEVESGSYTRTNVALFRNNSNTFYGALAKRNKTTQLIDYMGGQYVRITPSDPTAGSWTKWTYTDTLENCLKMMAMYFRNIDIYVDGICWSKVF